MQYSIYYMNHGKVVYITNHTTVDLHHQKFAVGYTPCSYCKLCLTSILGRMTLSFWLSQICHRRKQDRHQVLSALQRKIVEQHPRCSKIPRPCLGISGGLLLMNTLSNIASCIPDKALVGMDYCHIHLLTMVYVIVSPCLLGLYREYTKQYC